MNVFRPQREHFIIKEEFYIQLNYQSSIMVE